MINIGGHLAVVLICWGGAGSVVFRPSERFHGSPFPETKQAHRTLSSARSVAVHTFSSTPKYAGVAKRPPLSGAQRPKITPGRVWQDTNRRVIQAHGGGITKDGAYWYWFGEDRSQNVPKTHKAVHVYRSSNLMQWDDYGRALEIAEPADYIQQFGTDWQLERPKVFKVLDRSAPYPYVMYVHLDAAYKAAEVGVAVSNNIAGPYHLLKHFRPLGQESRDIGQFTDNDGTNYLIFESRPAKGFFIGKLTADGLDVAEKTALVPVPLEGGAIVRRNDTYFCIGSHLTGWAPNQNVFATARNLAGPWSSFHDIAAAGTNTYGGQSAMLLRVDSPHTESTVIFIGDIWKPDRLWDSRYLWLPVDISDDRLHINSPHPWRIDVQTGHITIYDRR